MARVLCASVVLAVGGAGCESTRDKAAKVAQEGTDAFKVKGVQVTEAARDVSVGDTTVLTDENGSAVVVPLTVRGTRPVASVPVSLAVQDEAGKDLWKNDAPGLQPSLTSIAVLEPGDEVLWVNDQVLPPAGEPAKATAIPGAGTPVAGALPEVVVGPAKVRPGEGVAVGQVENRSDAEQVELVVYGVARRGGEVVAAGRGIVPRLKPGAKAQYLVSFIGRPDGAEVEVAAPPTSVVPEAGR